MYQEYLAKNLTEKYSTLNLQMDKVVNDANGQLSHLRNKLSGEVGVELSRFRTNMQYRYAG